MSNNDDDSGSRRAGAGARSFSEKAPKPTPYEDPVDKMAREAETVDDRTRTIALLMSQGRWSKTKILQYANLWAVSFKTVANYACEAKRLKSQLRTAQGLKNAARVTLDQLQAVYELAMSVGDMKAAVAAARTMGEIRGAFPSKSAGKTEDKKPGTTVPAQFSEYVDHPDLLRFWMLTRVRPTPAQKKSILGGTPVEQVIREAGIKISAAS